MDNETVLVITQRDTTTQLQPLPTAAFLTLTMEGGLPGPSGPPGPVGPPGDGDANAYDPGDLTLWLENGLI